MSSPPPSPPSTDPHGPPAHAPNHHAFVVDDLADADQNALLEQLKASLVRRIYTQPATPAPAGVAEALADKAVFGRFKYHGNDTRQLRDLHNAVCYAEIPDARPLVPLTEDAPPLDRYCRALVEAITTYFRLARDGITQKTPIALAQKTTADFDRPLHASAYLCDLVRLIFDAVSGDPFERTATASKLVTGFGAYLMSCGERFWDSVGRHAVESDVDLLYWQLLFSMVVNTVDCDMNPAYSSPGLRWKMAMVAKLSLSILERPKNNLIEVAGRLVDIDYCHNIIEGGLALAHPVLGSAIVGPASAAMYILYEMAGCVQTQKGSQFTEYETDASVFQKLVDVDKGLKVDIVGIEVKEESLVSLDYCYFRKGALADFIDWRPGLRSTAMVSKHGIILYFPTEVGPWYDAASGGRAKGRDPMKLVLRVANGEREARAAREALSAKGKRLRTDWLSECPVSGETKKRFGYIVNKPGRTLVQRRGIRGNYGRIVAVGLVASGVATVVVNWAGRDNWLERVFDGAQVASLLAALTVIVIFFLTKTLANTLDLLAGVTEAHNIEQVAMLTGLSIAELQGVLTYARGTLYWLSEHRASYCRAVRLGGVVMTRVLDVERNAETRASVVAGKKGVDGGGDAVWVMQGRCTRMESTGTGDGVSRVAEEVRLVQTRVRGDSEDVGEVE